MSWPLRHPEIALAPGKGNIEEVNYTEMDVDGKRIEARCTWNFSADGMGEVYQARDERLGRDMAVKVPPRAVADDPERLAPFELEARLLATLNHPNIAAACRGTGNCACATSEMHGNAKRIQTADPSHPSGRRPRHSPVGALFELDWTLAR